MKDIFIMGIFAIVAYVFYKIMLKEPILPWKEKKRNSEMQFSPKAFGRKKKGSGQTDDELELKIFQDLFSDIKDVSNHMIRFHDNSFTLIAEVEPVNYYLKSQDEQENIDVTFESWLASINYPVKFYLQNRFIDISEPIQAMRKSMEESEGLNDAALDFGQSMINELLQWQKQTPRFETKRYLIFTHKIKSEEITADSVEELEEKIVEKAFAELMRRLNAAKDQLSNSDIHISLLPTEGIYQLLYYTFNRRKAVKNRFKDMVENEKLSLYVTADQTDDRIELVKEAIERNENKGEPKEGFTEGAEEQAS